MISRILQGRFLRQLEVFSHYNLPRKFSSSILNRNNAPASTDDFVFTRENVKTALQPELAALNTHCTLLNQTTPSQLLALTDVVPMMQIYDSLITHSAAHLAVRRVSQALVQTAKDSSMALRHLPQSQRAVKQAGFFRDLTNALDKVAISIIRNDATGKDIDNDMSIDTLALSSLFKAYEIVDPYAGVRFYKSMAPAMQSLCGCAVIPCMVKSRQPLIDVKTAFETDASPSDRGAADMAWACLRYGEIGTARVIFDQLVEDESLHTGPVFAFLLDAFVGDAPAKLALDVFNKYREHAPHHASMSRMLARLWNDNKEVEVQISVFREYLSRLTLPSELNIKTVATTVVSNVVTGSSTPDETLEHVMQLCQIYDTYMSSHTVFLNVILTETTNRWCSKRDEACDLILGVLSNYGPDDDSVVAFRVRLNAMEHLSNTSDIVKDLWESRKSLPGLPPLQKWDWLALARGSNASRYFLDEWKSAGSPFQRDLVRYCASRGYEL